MPDNEITRNPWVWGAIARSALLLIAAVYLPGLSDVLQTRAIGVTGWALVLVLPLVPLVAGQIVRLIERMRSAA